MLFRSNFANFTQVVRHEINIPHPTLPTYIDTIKRLAADFGQLGAEYEYTAPDGTVGKAADIRGHYFDSVVAQEQNGWTDEEREAVEKQLIMTANRWPEAVQVVERAAAVAPWPKYDTTHHSKIVQLAEDLGLVEQALVYEQENKNRESVVAGLSAKLTAPAPEGDEELAVA